MRIILIGAGGVGDAFARIAVRRDFFESCVVADYDAARAERTFAACLPDPAFLGDKMHGATCAGVWVTGKRTPSRA